MTDRLTQKRIAAEIAKLSPAGKPVSLPVGDVNGLALVLRPSTVHSWRMVYRPTGSRRDAASRTVTLGKYPALSLEDARRQGRALVGEIAKGGDPAREKRHKRADQHPTVARALDLYEAESRRVNTKTLMSTLRRGLKPYLGEELRALTRNGIVRQVKAIHAAGRPGAAADLRKHSRTFLEWAVNDGYVQHNVLAGLKMPRMTRQERLEQGDTLRAFTDDELRRIWAAAGDLGAFGNLVRLGLVTGLRRGELAHLRWSDIKSGKIVIPAPRTKMGVAHEVPISALAALVLARVPRGTSTLVFPSDRRNDGVTPMSGWSQLTARLAKMSAVPDFVLHGLRRTFRTKLTEAGVPEHVAELCLAHQRKGLAKLYDHSTLWPERVDATERACTRIATAVGEGIDKVTPLRPSAARG